jgi:hypothetical protein
MGKFLESEKRHQTKFKTNSPYFSEAARADGMYKGKLRPFCLPLDCAEENLFPEIRQTAPAYFAAYGIKWHDALNGKPSNHLCDSQVCCVTFFFHLHKSPVCWLKSYAPSFLACVKCYQ